MGTDFLGACSVFHSKVEHMQGRGTDYVHKGLTGWEEE